MSAQGLTKTLLNDEVVELLRGRIYSGEYPPGTHLRQEQLADELGVSRTPLREAFRTLRREGLLQESRQGVRVVSLDLDRVLAAYDVREVLEGLAARLAAARRTRALVEALERLVDTQERAVARGDLQAYTEANVDFHARIWQAAGNEYILGQSHLLRMTAQLFVPVAVVPRTLAAEAVDGHRTIVAAIAAGDEPLAEERARAHIRRTIALLGAEDAHSPPPEDAA